MTEELARNCWRPLASFFISQNAGCGDVSNAHSILAHPAPNDEVRLAKSDSAYGVVAVSSMANPAQNAIGRNDLFRRRGFNVAAINMAATTARQFPSNLHRAEWSGRFSTMASTLLRTKWDHLQYGPV